MIGLVLLLVCVCYFNTPTSVPLFQVKSDTVTTAAPTPALTEQDLRDLAKTVAENFEMGTNEQQAEGHRIIWEGLGAEFRAGMGREEFDPTNFRILFKAVAQGRLKKILNRLFQANEEPVAAHKPLSPLGQAMSRVKVLYFRSSEAENERPKELIEVPKSGTDGVTPTGFKVKLEDGTEPMAKPEQLYFQVTVEPSIKILICFTKLMQKVKSCPSCKEMTTFAELDTCKGDCTKCGEKGGAHLYRTCSSCKEYIVCPTCYEGLLTLM